MKRPEFIEAFLVDHPDLVVREMRSGDLFGGGVGSGAVFSPENCGAHQYRYLLWRMWDPDLPIFVALMLNPSTADELDDDPTVQRVSTRARRLGYGSVVVVNVFAWRDTSPAAMKKVDDPVGPANDAAIDAAVAAAGIVVCGWGADGGHLGRAVALCRRLEQSGVRLHCLRRTAAGHPEHPLYLSYSLEPAPWSPEEIAA